MSVSASFLKAFEQQRTRVQRRLSVRRLLRALLVGVGLAALLLYGARLVLPRIPGVAAVAQTPWFVPRLSFGLLAVIVLGAIALAFRRSWSRTQVALYLDAAYGSQETITTAEEEARSSSDASESLFLSAGTLLSKPVVLPPWLHQKRSALLALTPLLFTGALLLPVPASPALGPNSKMVQANAEALEKVIALGQLRASSPEERARLQALAKRAESLKADLQKGLTEQEALDRLGRLQDALREERQLLGSGERKQGLESAAARLNETPQTRKLAEALRNRDLTQFDKEMERLANEREKADRDAARKALEEAIKQAERNGAQDVAKALRSELKSFEEREARNEKLKELASAIEKLRPKTSELKKSQENFDRNPTDENAKKLASDLEKALEGLSPEEREQLAKNFARMNPNGRERASDAGAGPSLSPEELQEMLKQLASKDLAPPEAETDQGLQDGEQGARDTARMLVPQPGEGGSSGSSGAPGSSGSSGAPGSSSGSSGSGEANSSGGGSGHSEDKGTGNHAGSTPQIASAGDLKSRARAAKNPGAPVPGGFTVLGQGKEPGQVTESRTGDLRSVSGKELRSIDQSDVPSEYREQLHEYFQP